MTFKISKQQLAERDALAADLRKKAEALNIAIVAFNQTIQPVSQAVRDALEDYNGILEKARVLADSVTEAAQGKFDGKSEKWQEGDKGVQVRIWIELWEMSLEDVDLDLPDPLTEIDPDEQASAIEGATPAPAG
jgi:cell division septum initiation protein DivIVA